MRILFLSNYFPPEIGTGPHLPFELSESLVEAGHEVTVVTGFPRYNVPVMPERYRGRFLHEEAMCGVRVLRINAPNAYGKTRLSRGLVQLLAPPVLALRALVAESPDVVYTVTPPLMMGVATHLAASRFRVPWVVNVQDLFPQAMVDLGLLRNPTLIRFFEAMERYVYRRATTISVMSGGNRDHVVARGGDRGKVFTAPNWVDTDLIRPARRMNEFRAAHGLADEFVVLFAGTMGWSQGLDTVVDAGRELAAEPGVVFLMVGDGVEREKLEERAAGLANVRFLPMQPKETYSQVLAASDVCLATLRPEVTTPTIPSKICTIMAAGRPVVASLPPGDASRLVSDAKGGLLVPAGDARAMASAILTLKRDREAAKQMGIDGRRYAEEHLSRRVCVRRIEEILEQTTRKRG